jgi:hypothetical protein
MCMHVYVCICMYVYKMRKYMHVCVCMYMYVCVCMYVYMIRMYVRGADGHTYTDTHMQVYTRQRTRALISE